VTAGRLTSRSCSFICWAGISSALHASLRTRTSTPISDRSSSAYGNSSHTEYPFWYLQTDQVWEVRKADAARVREGRASQPPKGELLRLGAEGGLLPDVYVAVTKDPDLARDLALGLLAAHFPETLHEEILEQVGFDTAVAAAARRDPRFRESVLMAYEYRCALCDFEVRIDGALVGVEAAHVKWHQARGPSTVDNRISFCSLHHKLFDRGAFTLDDERRVVLSKRLTSAEPTRSSFEAQNGRPVRLPRTGDRGFATPPRRRGLVGKGLPLRDIGSGEHTGAFRETCRRRIGTLGADGDTTHPQDQRKRQPGNSR